MNIVHDLPAFITAIERIDDAGWLADLQHAIAEARSGPADDLDRYPAYKWKVQRFARLASSMLGISFADCHAAARQALLPETRLAVVMEIVRDFEQRLDEQATRDAAARSVRSFNRRVGA